MSDRFEIRECYIYAGKKYNRTEKKYDFTWYKKCEDWVKEYTEYKNKKRTTNPYNDPDSAIIGHFNQEYYETLTKFLNIREKDCNKDWVFLPPTIEKNIEIPKDRTIIVKGKNLFLSSDQFGFSEIEKANHNLEKRPYHYLEPEKTARYLYETRSIGGSFIWPKTYNLDRWSCIYNNLRGAGSYIEDRVDLTLLEIKHYLDNKNDYKKFENDIMYNQINNASSKMQEWLDHFKDFNDYVEYFMFDDFCIKKDNEYLPLDLTSMCVLDRNETPRIEDLCNNCIVNMLENLCSLVEKRSTSIKDEFAKNKLLKNQV